MGMFMFAWRFDQTKFPVITGLVINLHPPKYDVYGVIIFPETIDIKQNKSITLNIYCK